MVDKKLINYIKDGLKKGYSRQELEKILRSSGWSGSEIAEGFGDPKPQKNISKRQVITGKNNALDNFINKALAKGIPEQKIRQVLLQKKWPAYKINSTLSRIKKPQQTFQPKEISPVSAGIETKKSSGVKKIFTYVLWFFIISAVLSIGIGVFYYIQGIGSYTVVDPNTNQQVTGKCLNEDCSDLRNYVYDNLLSKLVLIISIAASIALVIVLLNLFMPQRQWIIWIADILFFIYILYLLYLWFTLGKAG